MATRKRRVAPLQWFTQAQFYLLIESETQRLFVGVQPGKDGWAVLALASPKDAATADDILDNHGHKLVGQYPAVADAMKAGEAYARAWAKGHKAARVGDCACDEITTKSKGKR